jgi:hypothetical protein
MRKQAADPHKPMLDPMSDRLSAHLLIYSK